MLQASRSQECAKSGRVSRIVGTILVLSLVGPTAALAYSTKVEDRCRDDYFRLCPTYPLHSASLRLCMESKHKQITRPCINALIDEGLVDRRRLKR